jgi:hypothetical protein
MVRLSLGPGQASIQSHQFGDAKFLGFSFTSSRWTEKAALNLQHSNSSWAMQVLSPFNVHIRYCTLNVYSFQVLLEILEYQFLYR